MNVVESGAFDLVGKVGCLYYVTFLALNYCTTLSAKRFGVYCSGKMYFQSRGGGSSWLGHYLFSTD